MKTDLQLEHPLPSRWPHRIAIALAAVVFPLIWVGGLVTTYDAGMAVPDWPGTYGYNMFLYPVETWITGPFDLLVEHGHRLLGSLSGFIAIALVIVTWKTETRRSVRWFSVALLLLVIGQGVLGGLRVLLDARTLAKLHGCVGPAFFACRRRVLRSDLSVVVATGIAKKDCGKPSLERDHESCHIDDGRVLRPANCGCVFKTCGGYGCSQPVSYFDPAAHRDRDFDCCGHGCAVVSQSPIALSVVGYSWLDQRFAFAGERAVFAWIRDLGRKIWLAGLV